MKKQLLLLIALFFYIQFNYSQVISIIGTTSPSGNWGTDTDMNTIDNITYTLNNVAITASITSNPDSGLKFRQGHDWLINWGSVAFPTGTGVQNGANIITLAGTYDVTFNRTTGAYSFTPSILSTQQNQIKQVKVYPNPTQIEWNITSINEPITSIEIFDILGKRVLVYKPNSLSVSIDAIDLNNGVYFAKIVTSTSNETIKIIKY